MHNIADNGDIAPLLRGSRVQKGLFKERKSQRILDDSRINTVFRFRLDESVGSLTAPCAAFERTRILRAFERLRSRIIVGSLEFVGFLASSLLSVPNGVP